MQRTYQPLCWGDEAAAQLDDFAEALRAQFRPVSDRDEELVHEVVQARWDCMRVRHAIEYACERSSLHWAAIRSGSARSAPLRPVTRASMERLGRCDDLAFDLFVAAYKDLTDHMATRPPNLDAKTIPLVPRMPSLN